MTTIRFHDYILLVSGSGRIQRTGFVVASATSIELLILLFASSEEEAATLLSIRRRDRLSEVEAKKKPGWPK
jgi:hypothetical protein